MGKAAKLKQIRRLANDMPLIKTNTVIGKIITGAELYKSGVKLENGDAIAPDQHYRQKTNVTVPLNHNKKMKRLYNKSGAEGVRQYVAVVQHYIQSQDAKEVVS